MFQECNNKTMKPKQTEEEDDFMSVQPPQMQTPFLLMINEKRNRVELHIRGMFVPPEMITRELTALARYADEYRTIAVYLNGPGGCLTTLTETLNILKLYETVITIACGEISSAAFILWASGDVRVVQKYCIFMAHRESYRNQGKTDAHGDMQRVTDSIGKRIVADLCSHILTPEEIDFIRYSEQYLTDEQILSRGVAISWEQFIEGEHAVPSVSSTILLGDRAFIPVADGVYQCARTGETYMWYELQYGTYRNRDKKQEEAADALFDALNAAVSDGTKSTPAKRGRPTKKKQSETKTPAKKPPRK